MQSCAWQRGSGCGGKEEERAQGSPKDSPGLELAMETGVGMEACHLPYLLGLAPFPTCLGTIWRLLYLFCCDLGRRAVFHCLAEEVGRRHRNMPVSRGITA